jgi:branched-chain amino acid transport system permease protein
MNLDIGLVLLQDGLTNGAIYLLLGLALVLVFSVTRVLFLPQGEYVCVGALGYALLLKGQLPGSVWMLLGLGGLAFVCDAVVAARRGRRAGLGASALQNLALPLGLLALAWLALKAGAPAPLLALLAVALVVPMGPMVYRLAFAPVAHASVLTLMIIAVAVHFMFVGLSLIFFGPEGMRVPALIDGTLVLGDLIVTAHSLLVAASAAVVVVALYLLFDRTLYGKALRATAVSRTGARLLGIRTHQAARLAFALAAGIGALCGVLLISLTTVYYDSGLAIGMRGFIGAVIGALVSFPVTAIGALFVGVVDSFAAFFVSALKDATLFLSILPVLLYLSLRRINVHAHEENE